MSEWNTWRLMVAMAVVFLAGAWTAYFVGALDPLPWWVLALVSCGYALFLLLRYLILRTGLPPRTDLDANGWEWLFAALIFTLAVAFAVLKLGGFALSREIQRYAILAMIGSAVLFSVCWIWRRWPRRG